MDVFLSRRRPVFINGFRLAKLLYRHASSFGAVFVLVVGDFQNHAVLPPDHGRVRLRRLVDAVEDHCPRFDTVEMSEF